MTGAVFWYTPFVNKNTETEIKFLKIDTKVLIKKLHSLQANDLGEDLFREIIFYSKNSDFKKEKKIVRLRKTREGYFLTYKERPFIETSTTIEIEIRVDDEERTIALLEKLGLVAYRIQEKKRHSFIYNNVKVDIDTWPGIPSYVELEGETEEKLLEVAKKLNLKGDFRVEAAGKILENFYNIPIHDLKFFTFDKVE